MNAFSQGGIVPGDVRIKLMPGPVREAINPSVYESYADECYLNRDLVCVRCDQWHRCPYPG